jgi:hypothetical protein
LGEKIQRVTMLAIAHVLHFVKRKMQKMKTMQTREILRDIFLQYKKKFEGRKRWRLALRTALAEHSEYQFQNALFAYRAYSSAGEKVIVVEDSVHGYTFCFYHRSATKIRRTIAFDVYGDIFIDTKNKTDDHVITPVVTYHRHLFKNQAVSFAEYAEKVLASTDNEPPGSDLPFIQITDFSKRTFCPQMQWRVAGDRYALIVTELPYARGIEILFQLEPHAIANHHWLKIDRITYGNTRSDI